MLKVVGAASCFQEALRCGLVVRGFVRCAAVGTGFVRQRPRRRRRAWLGSQLRGRESSFQSGALRGTTGLRRAARACSLAQVCRGTSTQSGALPVSLLQDKNRSDAAFYEVYIPVPYLWYLKGTLWRYRSYDFQAPGLSTTETYSQLYLSSHRRISTQSDADKSTKSLPESTSPAPTAPPATNTQRTTTTLLLRIFRLVAVTTRRPSRYFWAVQLVQLVRCSTNRTAQRRVLLPTPRTAERR